MDKYITIIGLEVHIEPNTKTKMFCSCPQDHFAKEPNTNVCPICLGLPGALPYANKEAIEKTVKLGLALGSKISNFSKFYRKHYFYPDLPKSFQTSQKDDPFCVGGELLGKKINHIHLEEDAGKLQHDSIEGKKVSLIDFNRSGCALIELVTEPVFNSVPEVINFLRELQLIAKYLGISNADMEKGTMRLEANISLSIDGSLPDYKVELKNINSFRFLEKALNAEIKRQSEALSTGQILVQETRGYDEAKQTTFSQRVKSGSEDYRYFPEADLPPVLLDKLTIESIRSQIPELPNAKRLRIAKEYGLSNDFAEILVQDYERVNYFEQACKLNNNYKAIANLMINKKLDLEYPEPAGLVKKMIEITNVDFAPIDLVQKATDEVILENSDIVLSYKNGKGQVLGFLIGQVQKKMEGKADPKTVSQVLIEKLNS